jgi:ABC-type transport system substrate-binding protein
MAQMGAQVLPARLTTEAAAKDLARKPVGTGAYRFVDPRKRKELYAEATQIVHEEKPWVELFQEIAVYGTSKRVSFRPRPDFRLIVSEMTLAR